MMEEKLKTLKYIEFIGYLTHKEYANNNIKKELRLEAIKWVKEIKFRMSYLDHPHTDNNNLIHTIDWIIYFFDLEESELE